MLDSLATNPSLPAFVLDLLIDRAPADPDLTASLARRTDLTPAQVDRLIGPAVEARPDTALHLIEAGYGRPGWLPALAAHPDPEIRRRLPEYAASTAALLFQDPFACVRTEAAHHALAPTLLEHLAADPDPEVRRAVATNPATPPPVLATLFSEGGNTSWHAAANPSTPPALVADFVHGWPIAARTDLPARTYRRLAADPLPGVREDVAANPALPADLFAVLAADPSNEVRRALATNPHIPLNLLADLAARTRIGPALLPRMATVTETELTELATGSAPMRRLVAMRPDLPLAVVERLAADPDDKVVAGIAVNPALTADQLWPIARRGVHARVAANPGTPAALLADLALRRAPGKRTLREIAIHPNATADALLACLSDDRARSLAAAHPALPTTVLVTLLHRAEPAAAANPALPVPQMLDLLAHHDRRPEPGIVGPDSGDVKRQGSF